MRLDLILIMKDIFLSSNLNPLTKCIKTKKVIDRGKRSKTLSELKLVENISKNLQSFSSDKSCAKGSPFFT